MWHGDFFFLVPCNPPNSVPAPSPPCNTFVGPAGVMFWGVVVRTTPKSPHLRNLHTLQA